MVKKNFTQSIYINKGIDKKILGRLTADFLTKFGLIKAVNLLESFKNLGFRYSTNGGISLSIEDLKIPLDKEYLISTSLSEISETNLDWQLGKLTDIERFQRIIDLWNTTSENLKSHIVDFFQATDPLNNIYMIAFSGARGNLSQVRQLIGMRGFMANQKGQVISIPIIKNFREGLDSVDYLISCYGARKGIVDTALRTADAGYLTRRLVEIGQDVIIREVDCFTNKGIVVNCDLYQNPYAVLKGRILAEDITIKSNTILKKGVILDFYAIDLLQKLKMKSVVIRSPLTCQSYHAICQTCYGWNLAYQQPVLLGEAIGVVAGQSIGEPGTQMTMRTFHTGGVFSGQINTVIRSSISGTIRFPTKGFGILSRNVQGKQIFQVQNELVVRIFDWRNKYQEIKLPEGCILFVKQNQFVKRGEKIGEFLDSNFNSFHTKEFKALLSPHDGEILFDNLKLKGNEKLLTQNNLFFNQKNGWFWLLRGLTLILPKNTEVFLANKQIQKHKPVGRLYFSPCVKSTSVYFPRQNILRLKYSVFSTKNSIVFYKKKYKKKKSIRLQKDIVISLFSTKFSILIGVNKSDPEFILKKNINRKKSPLYNELKKIRKKPNKPNNRYKVKYKQNRRVYKHDCFFSEFCFILISEKKNKSSNYVNNTLSLLIPNKPIVVKVNYKKNIKFTSKLFFSGEILFDKIKIQSTVFVQLFKIPNANFGYLFIYPVFEKQIFCYLPMLSKYLFLDNFILKKQNLVSYLEIDQYHGQIMHLVKLLKLINKDLLKISIKQISHQNQISKLNLILKHNSLSLIKTDFIDLSGLVARAGFFKDLQTKINILSSNYQIIEPFTRVAFFNFYHLKNVSIHSIRLMKGKNLVFNLVRKKDLISIFLENDNLKFSNLKFHQLGSCFYLETAGVIQQSFTNKISLRKATPLFLTKGAIVRHLNHQIIQQGENFAVLVNYRKQTDDIIQGLPKIEELIELRGRHNYSYLAETSGVILGVLKNWEGYSIRTTTRSSLHFYNLLSPIKETQNLIRFINIGEPLSLGPINPRELIRIFFNRNIRQKGLLEGLNLAIHKIQQILVNSIQAVYKSQGIYISDKHIEIVVKQMTSRVEICSSGDSPFLKGEILDTSFIQDLHLSLISNKLIPPYYQPYVSGVTKITLKGESFLSAASFQDTRRVLSESAIEGRVDWLRSIKANVIIGNLIPAGTGFSAYKSIYNHPEVTSVIQFFESRNWQSKKDLENSSQNRQSKKKLENSKLIS